MIKGKFFQFPELSNIEPFILRILRRQGLQITVSVGTLILENSGVPKLKERTSCPIIQESRARTILGSLFTSVHIR